MDYMHFETQHDKQRSLSSMPGSQAQLLGNVM